MLVVWMICPRLTRLLCVAWRQVGAQLQELLLLSKPVGEDVLLVVTWRPKLSAAASRADSGLREHGMCTTQVPPTAPNRHMPPTDP